MNTHRGLLNRLQWMQETYHLGAEDRVLQKTPFSFDVSVWEFFWPLIAGASLIIAQPEGHRDNIYLARTIKQYEVSVLHFVPSMLEVFLINLEDAAWAGLRLVISSGEALSLELQKRFFARFTAELHNLYGPTEVSIDVTFWACQRSGQLPGVPIGHPINNITVYLLDAHGHPVPTGVPGELYIGGYGLARGYLQRADLTAERFVPDPFSGQSGARLYRTGDQARYLPDGAIEYLGRLDEQVKLRGYRIELGEIEAVLGQLAGVQQAVVLLREDRPGDKHLVAYVVPQAEQSVTASELRHLLRERVPDYMVPSAFVLVEALPLTANGKLDHRSLPIPRKTRRDVEENYVAPQSPVEEILAEIWSQVLNLERVGIHDNFFDLGGNSLFIIQVTSRIREAFDIHISPRRLYEVPTIAKLAAMIVQMLLEQDSGEIAEALLTELEQLS